MKKRQKDESTLYLVGGRAETFLVPTAAGRPCDGVQKAATYGLY
jgi:hypothetical protein